MMRHRVARRRAFALAVPAVAAAAVALNAILPSEGTGQSAPVRAVVPALGVADAETTLIGGVSAGPGAGETWGLRMMGPDVPPPAGLEYGPQPAGRTIGQPAFLRHVEATGWAVADVPRDTEGRPMRGFSPNLRATRMTAAGAAIVPGRDSTRETGRQMVLLVRDPGGQWRERALPQPSGPAPEPAPAPDPTPTPTPDPTPDVPDPGSDAGGSPAPAPDAPDDAPATDTPDANAPDGGEPTRAAAADPILFNGEALGTDQGAGRVAAAPYDTPSGRAGAFVGITGPEAERAIAHFDGERWTRELLELEAGLTSVRVLAIAATPADAWALVRTNDTPARGVELLRRERDGSTWVWRRAPLDAPLLEAAATPSAGVESLAPLGDAAESLTATPQGVWVDIAFTVTTGADAVPVQHTGTLFVDASARKVTGTWCDASATDGSALCDRPLGFGFSRGTGYRSFAWPGDGFGARIVTNPVDPGGDDDTNRGTYARLDGDRFTRLEGGGQPRRISAAFTSPSAGWLEGPVQVGTDRPPVRLRSWPAAVRFPLTDAVTAPGTRPGALDAQALAVGAEGAVLRHVSGQGWSREFLLSSSGAVARPRLRGVAWPESGRAHAVGDGGAMWMWRSDTGLWERDPAAPVGFEAHLMDVAFQPGAAERGYAVGRAGTLLRYDKTWTQDTLPPGLEGRDLSSVAFAGSQALVAAGGDLLVNDDGGGWRVDEGVRALLATLGPRAAIIAVAGLPDGGAVLGGRGFVLERDTPGGPWRFSDQPLAGQTIVAAAAVRTGPRVSAVVSVVPALEYPLLADPVQLDPDVPAPILPPWPLPGDGYVLREVGGSWRDEQRAAFPSFSADRPLKPDPVAAFLLDPATGDGWAIGGWSGDPDAHGRGTTISADRERVQTAAVLRYAAGGDPAGPAALQAAPVPTGAGPVRFAVGGHAQCEDACADLADKAIGPDRMLQAALRRTAELAVQPGGPGFFVNTGGRLRERGGRPMPVAEARRYEQLLASQPGLPVYTAVSAGDSAGGTVDALRTAFAAQPTPMGEAAAPPGIAPVAAAPAAPGARTHYALDQVRPEGTLRVVVIDNSRGSLGESDPHQNPPEPQLPWLRAVLADAKQRGIATVVVGSRDLSRFAPRLNVASDGEEVAQALVDGGASAYFFERPEENRAIRIPSGAEQTIPAFGTGTLGYRSPLRVAGGLDEPLSLFGDGAFLLAEVDLRARDEATNVAPVSVRGIPIIDELGVQAVDGTLLRRSRPALFQGLGRRPVAGDRWGESSGDGGPEPPGGDPYTALPADPCMIPGCETRIAPEVEFASSNPDIGDFVRQDPASTNQRKPFIGPDDKVVSDARSPLFCAFNAGTTTITIRAGGLSYAQQVTVLDGSVQRPCGTRPLDPSRFTRSAPAAPAIQPPTLPAVGAPPAVPNIPIPAAPPAAPPAAQEQPQPRPEKRPPRPKPLQPPPEVLDPLLPQQSTLRSGAAPATPPPPASGFGQPIPPGGVSVRVFEEKREEEAATEESRAFSVYNATDPLPIGPVTVGAVLLLALAGVAIGPPRTRKRRRHVTLATVRAEHRPIPTRRRNHR